MNAKNQNRPDAGKRSYTKPEVKKREQLKEITESPAPAVTAVG